MLRRGLDSKIKNPGFLGLVLLVLGGIWKGRQRPTPGTFKGLPSSLDFILFTGAQHGQIRVFE